MLTDKIVEKFYWKLLFWQLFLKFQMCFFKVKCYLCISQEWLIQLMWNEKKVHRLDTGYNIGIDTKIEVIVVSPTTWEAHHSPRAKPESCGELPRSLVTPQWPKSRYQFLFYSDASKHIRFMQIRVCKSRKSLIKLLQISHCGKHGHRPLSQQPP